MRARPVADDRRLGKEAAAIFARYSSRSPTDVGRLFRLVELIVPDKGVGRLPQLRRRRESQAPAMHDHHAENDQAGSPFQMKQREHGQHDRDRDHRRSRDDDERHVDDEAERDRAQQQRLPDPVRPQQTDDRIGQRHRAQRELLALVDIVLDEDAAPPGLVGGLQRKAGLHHHQPRHHHQQGAGHQECDEDPHSARRPFEMIEQPRQHQQLEGGTDGVKPRGPRRVRPERADKSQTDQRKRQIADRLFQQAPVGPPVHHPRHGAEPARHEDRHQCRRPRQCERGQNGKDVRNRRPQRPVSPVPPHQRHRWSRSAQAHALPPRARSTSDVVLWPGRMSTSTTSPPAASTISWPTTCSRV